MTIRFATLADAPALLAIYAPYVADSFVSLEYEVPSLTEFTRRIETIQQQLPYLVAEADGHVLGYAYASKHHDRAGYQWSVDTSVYIHADGHRQGIGRQLYDHLFDFLRRQGYYTAYAGITIPNPKSDFFHRSMGFDLVGTYHNVGYKMGAWRSVSWFQYTLQPYPINPTPPLSVHEIV
ncbi:GNAT family N-acetyltransferase [Spirosoma sp. KUDC1026]|uniref:GNAT family N-acetyltransferase n=1 Tax=Spirosoma sp. KUDC1026 TaxID=2745947 RepID=UPI00159B8FE4|nr:GNAT family N-acetyltransferase [Spirosoma sp. KUDC1026]QKZ14896.1 N-acetyltransferase family protein [Spirosoma sp. KUDC1026]